jgi:hypothetical protein
MRKPMLTLLCLCCALCAYAEGRDETEGTGVRHYDYRGFTAVETGWGIDVQILQTDDFSVTLFTDPETASRIEIVLVGSTLKIGMRQNSWFLGFKGGSARVEIGMPALRRLEASGGSHVELVFDTGTSTLLANLSGGSSLEGNLHAAGLEIEGSGGSTARLTGAAKSLDVRGSGGSGCMLTDFQASDANVDLSGGSWAEVSASGTLTVHASGGSHAVVKGNPRIGNQDLSGGSWIRRE